MLNLFVQFTATEKLDTYTVYFTIYSKEEALAIIGNNKVEKIEEK